ncbi:glycosyltransferase [Cesiribacter sp. SM1]|uniref:CgeB family protein n=1 Tax=Cesiribacter sp. SM1 TaxID=2861196 RepID=UPI001CD5D609|nr:glycosyltransferase [Cesiribacter sp. SM1]
MNNILYIGQYTPGTTSRMRAEALEKFALHTTVIDVHVPFYQTSRIWRSFGFRFKHGPLVANTQKYILDHLSEQQFDLVWVDKGILLGPAVLQKLQEQADKVVHYTPDAAFYQNQSQLFNQSLPLYTAAITTKSFELVEYYKFLSPDNVILTTQGYDPAVHRPYHTFEEKTREVVFVGLYEPARATVIQSLIQAGIHVSLVGYGWKTFFQKNFKCKELEYLGDKIAGEAYGHLLSSAYFGMGLLSKRFPEKHTTRTFEIPACGTLLLTEKNLETLSFYSAEEVAFYTDVQDLIQQIIYLKTHKDELKKRTERGHEKVKEAGYAYTTLLKAVLDKLGV